MRNPVFVTRRFPPSVGGMETLSEGIWHAIRTARPDSVLIANGGPNRALLWWLPLAWLRLAGLVLRGRVDLVVTGDAPVFALMLPLARLRKVRTATVVLGLDLTYDQWLYRSVVRRALRGADQIIAISTATREVALEIGLKSDRIEVLRLGTRLPGGAPTREQARASLAISGLDPERPVLVTLGRLVRRKGVAWFVAEVLPALPPTVQYAVAGDGPGEQEIRAAAETAGVASQVHLLGRVDEETREALMRGGDIFVQPNIPVPGDMEGFGLVTIEAATRGSLVVASDLEGLRDAVIDGSTGILLPPEDSEAWVKRMSRLVADPSGSRELADAYRVTAHASYGEEQMAQRLAVMLELTRVD